MNAVKRTVQKWSVAIKVIPILVAVVSLKLLSHTYGFEVIALEKEGVQANYIIRMKNEQSTIRKGVLRIHTIRDTNFIASAYAIVEALGFSIALGMILMKIEPFYESLFFTVLVTFLIAYMLFLIKDLDNPFEYAAHGEGGTEVPLKPLHDLELRLNKIK